MNIVFVGRNPKSAQEIFQQHPEWNVLGIDGSVDISSVLNEHCPDLLITDIPARDSKSSQLLAQLRQQAPHVALLVISEDGPEAEVQALGIGAAMYVSRSRIARDLETTVQRLGQIAGRTYRAQLRQYIDRYEQEYTLPNDTRALGALIGHCHETADWIGLCDRQRIHRLAVALDEAVSNAMIHGNLEVDSTLREQDEAAYRDAIEERMQQSPYRDRRVKVSACFSKEEARFVIRDEGPGFDVNNLPDSRDPSHLEKPHGRGLLLMRHFVDEVRYNDRGNEVTLVVELA